MGSVLGGTLDVLFPLRCAGCGRGPWPFCETCRSEMAIVSAPLCQRCGRPVERSVDGCRDCPPATIDLARAPFVFAGPVRRALHRLKFSGWRAVAQALGQAMASVADWPEDPAGRSALGRAQAVTWVPVSRARRARRGYDQSKALAAVVARRLDVPRVRLLARPGDSGPQARRSGEERRRALLGAFASTGRSPPDRVVLVDDVLTTGATAAECAGVLRAAGASEVVLLTAARSLSGALPARCYSGADSRPSLWLPGERPR